MKNTKQLKLVKYRGYEDSDYVWFYVNSDDIKISEEFQSEKEAQDWLDYQAALIRIEVLMDAEPNAPEGEEREKLTKLVEKYETQKGHKASF